MTIPLMKYVFAMTPIQDRMTGLPDSIYDLVQGLGLTATAATLVYLAVICGLILIFSLLSFWASRWILSRSFGFIAGKTRTTWDDILSQSPLFSRLALLGPGAVVYLFASAFEGALREWIERGALAFMVVAGLMACNNLLNSAVSIYQTLEISRSRPIKGFVDLVKILLFLTAGILFLAALLDLSPVGFLTGMGAMTAVLVIVFKDTLLGLVASFQIATGDTVREGDWIEMPKYGADGDVIDVSLHTVKVRNWDKTITTIPTYALVSDSFKNWRGMEESGGRRIKRCVYIDMNSIRFCTAEMIERFRKIKFLEDYIAAKQQELEAFNIEHGFFDDLPVNGRHMTNVGTFRAYIIEYLKRHPQIREDMTFLVRQLAPAEHGLPIEIYVFSAIQAWVAYEAVQADIFDHLLAVVHHFDLRVFQNPSGADIQALSRS